MVEDYFDDFFMVNISLTFDIIMLCNQDVDLLKHFCYSTLPNAQHSCRSTHDISSQSDDVTYVDVTPPGGDKG